MLEESWPDVGALSSIFQLSYCVSESVNIFAKTMNKTEKRITIYTKFSVIPAQSQLHNYIYREK